MSSSRMSQQRIQFLTLSYFTDAEQLSGTWKGSFGCGSDVINIELELVNRDSFTTLTGQLKVQGYQLVVRGTFASYFKAATLMSEPANLKLAGGRSVSVIELNGDLETPVYIEGVALLTSSNTKEICNLTLRRESSKFG